jgi:hypothetical protein
VSLFPGYRPPTREVDAIVVDQGSRLKEASTEEELSDGMPTKSELAGVAIPASYSIATFQPCTKVFSGIFHDQAWGYVGTADGWFDQASVFRDGKNEPRAVHRVSVQVDIDALTHEVDNNLPAEGNVWGKTENYRAYLASKSVASYIMNDLSDQGSHTVDFGHWQAWQERLDAPAPALPPGKWSPATLLHALKTLDTATKGTSKGPTGDSLGIEETDDGLTAKETTDETPVAAFAQSWTRRIVRLIAGTGTRGSRPRPGKTAPQDGHGRQRRASFDTITTSMSGMTLTGSLTSPPAKEAVPVSPLTASGYALAPDLPEGDETF